MSETHEIINERIDDITPVDRNRKTQGLVDLFNKHFPTHGIGRDWI